MDHTVHGILQARILEWVVYPFSRGSSQPRDWTQVPRIAGRLFTSWAAGEAQEYWSGYSIPSRVDLPNPGFELESPALQVDSLPHTESLKDSSLCYINTTHTHTEFSVGHWNQSGWSCSLYICFVTPGFTLCDVKSNKISILEKDYFG